MRRVPASWAGLETAKASRIAVAARAPRIIVRSDQRLGSIPASLAGFRWGGRGRLRRDKRRFRAIDLAGQACWHARAIVREVLSSFGADCPASSALASAG